jgi:multicomponent K+:H+ antiporter subunit E
MNSARWLPHPLFSVAIFFFWLLLVNEVSLLQLLAATLLALVVPRLTRAFWPEHPRVRRPLMLLEYLAVVLWDILLANLLVARLILTPGVKLRPEFIEVPLTISDPSAVTMLAATVSLTPGTVSADVDVARGLLLVHALDVENRDEVVRHIKQRYERRIGEIFG